eukprot:6243586-Prymnesium_polylepis.1
MPPRAGRWLPTDGRWPMMSPGAVSGRYAPPAMVRREAVSSATRALRCSFLWANTCFTSRAAVISLAPLDSSVAACPCRRGKRRRGLPACSTADWDWKAHERRPQPRVQLASLEL